MRRWTASSENSDRRVSIKNGRAGRFDTAPPLVELGQPLPRNEGHAHNGEAPREG